MNVTHVHPKATAQGGTAGSCRLCGAGLSHGFVDLGMSPLCEAILPEDALDRMEPFYPLRVMVCGACFLVQLREYVSPSDIFTEYAYYSSFSSSWVAHAKAYCEAMARRFGLGADSLVVELASNDGYLLQHFLPMGIPVLGIEPAVNCAEAAIAKGVPTRVDFFGRRLADAMVAEGMRADLIVGNNVLAQVPDINDFVAGMPRLLTPDGVVTLEVPHLLRLLEGNQFDTIYHEHFSYFSLVTLDIMARRHGLRIIDVEELPTHGGSLRVFMAHDASGHATTPAVPRMLEREARAGLRRLETYSAFTRKVHATKRRLLSFLIDVKEAGHTICGYGAPGKGSTLLNYCGIGTDFLDFTVDRNPYKHGRYTPGMHIPIRPVEAIDTARPDYILILPWNLTAEIVAQMRHVAEWDAKFIVPIPEVAVLDPKEAFA